MPDVGQAEPVVLSVPLDGFARRSLFSHLDIGGTLPTSNEDWSAAQAQFEEAAAPAEVSIIPGGLSIPRIKKQTAFGNFVVEALSLDAANELVGVASNGRLKVEKHPDKEKKAWLVPVLPVERDAYIGGRTILFDLFTEKNGDECVYTEHIQSWIKEYKVWRQNYFRDHFREMFGRRSGRLPALPGEANGPKYDSEGNLIGGVDTLNPEKFSTFIEAFKAKLQVIEDPFADITILPEKTLSSRTWGIEIEAVNINDIPTPKYWILHGDVSLRGVPIRAADAGDHRDDCDTRLEPFCDCGSCVNECSCGFASNYERLTETGEWNSPILRSFHSRGLKHLCDNLEFRESNNTAGIHVHIGAGDLSPEQAVQVSLIYTLLEPLFEQQYGRESRRFCESVSAAEQIRRMKKMRRARSLGQDAKTLADGQRYYTVNLSALQSHGTIEFRAMGPKYNYEFLIRWSYFLRELLNIAKAGVTQKHLRGVRTFRDVISVFAKYGKETPTPEWVESGVVKSINLAEENRRAPNPELDPTIGFATVFDYYDAREPVFASDRHNGDRSTTGMRM